MLAPATSPVCNAGLCSKIILEVETVILIVAGGSGGVTQPAIWRQLRADSQGRLDFVVYLTQEGPTQPAWISARAIDIPKLEPMTGWGSAGIALAMQRMVRVALRVYPNARRFLTTSGDSIPVRPAAEYRVDMLDTRMGHSRSELAIHSCCAEPFFPGRWVSGSQWMLLTRRDAVAISEYDFSWFQTWQVHAAAREGRSLPEHKCYAIPDEWFFPSALHQLGRLPAEALQHAVSGQDPPIIMDQEMVRERCSATCAQWLYSAVPKTREEVRDAHMYLANEAVFMRKVGQDVDITGMDVPIRRISQRHGGRAERG